MIAKPKVHSVYVPSEGPDSCDLMVVGEAPGKEEESNLRPFIGRSGKILNGFFADRLGLRRDAYFLTNLCKFRPERNRFQNCLDTPQLESGIEELKAEIERVKPKVILAAGAWPMYFLTGKTNNKGEIGEGIKLWRNSVLPNTLVEGGPKVVPSYHPAFLTRNWKFHPVVYNDWEHVYEESKFPEIIYPEYETLIDPPHMEEIIKELCNAELVVCDIETFKDRTLACCGFSDREDRALVITFQHRGWQELVQQVLASKARKSFQFGAFDINFLRRFYGIRTENYYFDTYVGAANLDPEFPRGLDFLVTMDTRFPYYKEERKTWSQKQDINILWEYNAKDCVAQFTITKAQMKRLKEEKGWTGEPIVS